MIKFNCFKVKIINVNVCDSKLFGWNVGLWLVDLWTFEISNCSNMHLIYMRNSESGVALSL